MRGRRVHTLARGLALTTLLTGLGGTTLDAQVLGGRYAFAWLDNPASAAATGLGGWSIRSDVRDPAQALWNPAALNAHTDRTVQFAQDLLPTGAGRSSLTGGYHLAGPQLDAAAHIQYVGFSELVGRDVTGARTANFNAADYALGVSVARGFEGKVRVGATVQVVGGRIEQYTALGVGVSAGLLYHPDSARLTTWSLVVRNAGALLDGYTDQRDPLPLHAAAGVSRRLAHLPLRVGVLYRHLDRWNLLYDDPSRREDTNILGEVTTERGAAATWFDNFGRHLALNAELYLGRAEVVQLRGGYDHQRQREGRVANFRSLAGFSYGLGLNLRRFQLDYGHGVQHLGGGPHHISLLLDLAPATPRVRRERRERPERTPRTSPRRQRT